MGVRLGEGLHLVNVVCLRITPFLLDLVSELSSQHKIPNSSLCTIMCYADLVVVEH